MLTSPRLVCLALAVATAGCGEDTAHRPQLSETQQAMNGAGTFQRVQNFGANPGALNMYFYTPSPAPQGPAPLVLALHGCSQNASNYRGVGWEPLADEYGFYVLYPEQASANNTLTCFNWGGEYGDPDNIERGDGENQSIINMIDWASENYGVDRDRVFITGFSGGGAMTALMLATWPDVFAAGAPIAGIPYLCYDPPGGDRGYESAVVQCLSPGNDYTPQKWGDYVRRANPNYDGPLPWLSIWQGSNDGTVAPRNQTELYEQWANAHGLDVNINNPDETDETPTSGIFPGTATRKTFNNAEGQGVIELWSYPAGHAVPLGEECPASLFGSYTTDIGVCSSYQIARFFGITGEGGGPGGGADRSPPTVNITAPAAGEQLSGVVTVIAEASDNVGVTQVTFKANDEIIGTANSAPWQIEWDTGAEVNGSYTLSAEASDAAGNQGVDADTPITISGGAVDDTPPTIQITSPMSGDLLRGFVTLSAEASDDNSVAEVEFFLDDASLGAVATPNGAGGYELGWDSSLTEAGEYTLLAVARDAAGNEGSAEGVDVTLAGAGPTATVTFTQPVDGATVAPSVLSVAAEVDAGDTPVRSVVFLSADAGGQVALSVDQTPPYAFDWDLRNRDLGPVTLVAQAYANDESGNALLMGVAEIEITVADEGAGGSGGNVGGSGGNVGGSGGLAGGSGGAVADEPEKVGKEFWGCSAGGQRSPLWLLPLLALGLRRRRR